MAARFPEDDTNSDMMNHRKVKNYTTEASYNPNFILKKVKKAT